MVVAGFLASGLLKFLYFYLDDVTRAEPGTLGVRLLEEGTGTLTGVLLFPLLLLLCLRRPLTRDTWRRRIPLYLGSGVALSGLATLLRAATRSGLSEFVGLGPYDYGDMRWRYLMELPNDLAGLAVLVGLIHGIRYWEAARRRELRTVQLESKLAQAQLQSLRLQLQPHFLFNAINTVSAVMYEDPMAADAMLGRLSDLLRAMLQGSPAQETTLAEEMKLVDAYLGIMQRRFEERLSVTVSVAPEVGRAAIPQFLLQPLVENALRHGLEPGSGAARVRISAERQNGRLCVDVRDSGAGFVGSREQALATGIGLSNTASRLAALYGDAASLSLENAAEGGAVVRIELPYRESAG